MPQSFRFRTSAGAVGNNCALQNEVQTADRSGSGDQGRSGHGVEHLGSSAHAESLQQRL